MTDQGPAKPNSEDKPFDPMQHWRSVRDAYLEACSKAMIDMVNSDAYAEATGEMLNASLTVSAPVREAVEKSMLKALEQLAMPSRADFVSIAERMTNLEMRLDDFDAKLDLIANSVSARPTRSTGRRAPSSRKIGSRLKSAKRGH